MLEQKDILLILEVLIQFVTIEMQKDQSNMSVNYLKNVENELYKIKEKVEKPVYRLKGND